jgi:hypothetical protein
MTALRLLAALGQTALAAGLWRIWLEFKSMEIEYSPAVLTAAHFHMPPHIVRDGIVMSVVAAYLWFLAIRSAER